MCIIFKIKNTILSALSWSAGRAELSVQLSPALCRLSLYWKSELGGHTVTSVNNKGEINTTIVLHQNFNKSNNWVSPHIKLFIIIIQEIIL